MKSELNTDQVTFFDENGFLILEGFLDAEEDYLLAINRLEKNNPRISLEDLEKKLGLEN